jgi:hypothetical protein
MPEDTHSFRCPLRFPTVKTPPAPGNFSPRFSLKKTPMASLRKTGSTSFSMLSDLKAAVG